MIFTSIFATSEASGMADEPALCDLKDELLELIAAHLDLSSLCKLACVSLHKVQEYCQ